MIFAAAMTVRFNHVDAAGIVFYPRYMEMLNEVTERWFEEGLGTSFRALHLDHKCGVPLRHIEVDFMKASRLGDVLRFGLTVPRIGASSFDLDIVCVCGEEKRLTAHLALVHVGLDPIAPKPLPQTLADRMAAFKAL
jgi:4-hydroxybenzoyl-CoA thioesterase